MSGCMSMTVPQSLRIRSNGCTVVSRVWTKATMELCPVRTFCGSQSWPSIHSGTGSFRPFSERRMARNGSTSGSLCESWLDSGPSKRTGTTNSTAGRKSCDSPSKCQYLSLLRRHVLTPDSGTIWTTTRKSRGKNYWQFCT